MALLSVITYIIHKYACEKYELNFKSFLFFESKFLQIVHVQALEVGLTTNGKQTVLS